MFHFLCVSYCKDVYLAEITVVILNCVCYANCGLAATMLVKPVGEYQIYFLHLLWFQPSAPRRALL